MFPRKINKGFTISKSTLCHYEALKSILKFTNANFERFSSPDWMYTSLKKQSKYELIMFVKNNTR